MSRLELKKTMKKSKQVLKGIAKNCAIQTEFVVIMWKGCKRERKRDPHLIKKFVVHPSPHSLKAFPWKQFYSTWATR